MKNKDWVLGTRCWGKKSRDCGLAVLFTVALASQMGRAEEMHKITVRAYNYAEVSSAALAEAESEATRVFERMGLAVAWIDCRPSAASAPRPAACAELLGPADLALRILPSIKSARPDLRDSVGFAIVLKEGGRSAYASVFYDRVEELAAGGHCSRAAILGIAMAHEIGHLLLGTNGHARQGIMRARWEREDLRKAAQRYLVFDSEQAHRIRREAGARRSVALNSQTQR